MGGPHEMDFTKLVEYDCATETRIPSTYNPEYNLTDVMQPAFSMAHKQLMYYPNSISTPAAIRTGPQCGNFASHAPLAADCLAIAKSLHSFTWASWAGDWKEPDPRNWKSCSNSDGSQYPGCVVAAAHGTCEIRLEWTNKHFQDATSFDASCNSAKVNGGLALNMLASTQKILGGCQQSERGLSVTSNMDHFSDEDKDECQGQMYFAKAQ